jgi:hypothetical protein
MYKAILTIKNNFFYVKLNGADSFAINVVSTAIGVLVVLLVTLILSLMSNYDILTVLKWLVISGVFMFIFNRIGAFVLIFLDPPDDVCSITRSLVKHIDKDDEPSIRVHYR